jgi:hypothetical protein
VSATEVLSEVRRPPVSAVPGRPDRPLALALVGDLPAAQALAPAVTGGHLLGLQKDRGVRVRIQQFAKLAQEGGPKTWRFLGVKVETNGCWVARWKTGLGGDKEYAALAVDPSIATVSSVRHEVAQVERFVTKKPRRSSRPGG